MDIKNKYVGRMSGLLGDHSELILAIHNKKSEAKLASGLSVNLALQAAVLWESFFHELILHYAMQDPARLRASLEERVRQSIETKFGKTLCKSVSINWPVSHTLSGFVDLLDPTGQNITSSDPQAVSSRANSVLAVQYAKRLSLSPEDKEFMEYVTALRNFLSHNSVRSRLALRAIVDGIRESANRPFHGKLSPIGAYLKHVVDANKSRSVLIVERMIDIANTL